jgi:hypothetical protein
MFKTHKVYLYTTGMKSMVHFHLFPVYLFMMVHLLLFNYCLYRQQIFKTHCFHN